MRQGDWGGGRPQTPPAARATEIAQGEGMSGGQRTRESCFFLLKEVWECWLSALEPRKRRYLWAGLCCS